VTDDSEFVAELRDLLIDAFGATTVVDLHRLSAGASRETWSFDAKADGITHQLVLQRQRHGAVAGINAVAEAQLLRHARAEGIAAPEVIAAGLDHALLGSSFLVARRVPGESIPRRVLRDPEFEGARSRFVDDAAQQLAAIHRLDPTHHHGSLRHVADELELQRTLHESFADPHPVFDLVLRWLDLHRPVHRPDTVLHGDFRMGNLLFDSNGITAVLDWELAGIGQPGLDLGWLASRSWRFGGPGELAGIASVPEFLAAYGAAGGTPFDEHELQWWRALATLRWGNICRMMVEDHLSGRTRSVELATIGRRVAEVEYDLFMTVPEVRQ